MYCNFCIKVSAVLMVFAATNVQVLLYDTNQLQCSAQGCS